MYAELVTMTVRPENVAAFLAGRDAAMAAVQERYPELTRATLVRLDEDRWVDWVEWASLEQARAAAEQAPALEPVAAWLGLIDAVESFQHGTVEHAFDPARARAVPADR